MQRLIVLTVTALAVAVGGIGTSTAEAKFKDDNAWIQKWTRIDRSVYTSINVAARTFNVSSHTLRAIVGAEGGNINPAKLRVTLCNPYAYGIAGGGGLGWNNIGSFAFGPFQFMLDAKPACMNHRLWGTFGDYDDAAFRAAKSKGVAVPYRFKHPASNVGQATTAAYMLATPSTGGINHWCASMC